jgi:hypothetical protein
VGKREDWRTGGADRGRDDRTVRLINIYFADEVWLYRLLKRRSELFYASIYDPKS